MGKLIVFEGSDGSGKSTQFKLLTKRLRGEGADFHRLQFPQYLEPSSALIRMYLGGEFGESPDDVNAYAAVHQGGKLPPEAREDFFRWLYDFEFAKMGLPKPDLVICLDMPVELAEELMRRREEQTHTMADIHERNDGYLRQCRATAAEVAGFYGWTVVPCARDGVLRSIEEIHEEIYAHVKKCMEG